MRQLDAIKKLESTRADLDAARAELQRIGGILNAGGMVPTTEAADEAVAQADAELQDMLAAQALGEVDDDVVAAVRKKLERAVRDLDLSRTATNNHRQLQAGAERRLNEAHAAVSAADEAHKRAQANYVLAELQLADEAYTKSAMELMQSAGRVFACAAYLKRHSPSLVPAASASHLTMPSLPTIGPASAVAVQKRTGGREHGVYQALTDPRLMHIDVAGLDTEIEFASYGRPLAA